MKLPIVLLALLAFGAPARAADGFSTLPEYQADFDAASVCKPIKNRRVWKGKIAFYWQAPLFYTAQSGAADPTVANPVPLKSNTKKALASFVEACRR